MQNELGFEGWRALRIVLFEIGEKPVSGATLLTVCVILLATFVSSWLVQGATRRAFRIRRDSREGTIRAVARLLHYGTLLLGFGIALETLGIDLGALFAAGAIFAVGIGFAMQSIAQNFVSGVILLVERSIKPGDIVEVDKSIVKVTTMGIRATIVVTRDGENVIVPNSVLIQSSVKNFTLGDNNYRVKAKVGVVYGSDMKEVRAALIRTSNKIAEKWGTSAMTPLVAMTSFGDNAVEFEVGVWTKDPWEYRMATSELYEAVWWALKDVDVVIAFPQLDLHLDSAVVEALASR